MDANLYPVTTRMFEYVSGLLLASLFPLNRLPQVMGILLTVYIGDGMPFQ